MLDIFDVDKLIENTPKLNKCVICGTNHGEIKLWSFRDKIPKQLLKNFKRRADTATYNYNMCDSCHKFWDDNNCITEGFRIGYTIVDGLFGIITILDLAIACPLDTNQEEMAIC